MATETRNNNARIFLASSGGETWDDFIERNRIYQITAQDLLDLNRDNIYPQYTYQDKVAIKEENGTWLTSGGDLTTSIRLPEICAVIVNPNNILAETVISQTDDQIPEDDFYAFASEKIQEVYQSEGFTAGGSTRRSPECFVVGWFKSLYYVGVDKDGKRVVRREGGEYSEFADLSRHIVSLSTSVTANGGSFSIRLPLLAARDGGLSVVQDILTTESGEKRWGTMTGELGGGKKMIYEYGERGEYYSKASFADIEGNYFNWLISANDLLFISFEKLDVEMMRADDAADVDQYSLSSKIAEGIFDMIGLVDSVKVVTDAASASAWVEVTGRDLMKLLIDDGSFFFNPSTTSDPSSIFDNEPSWGQSGDIRDADLMSTRYNNPINRLRRLSGEIDIFANQQNMNIEYVLRGVLSQLCNVEVVPGYVFESWGDERTKYSDFEPQKKQTNG